ncbi:hypothetical protein GCM10020220_115340 [Nonomuraea rubra]|uniref:hypothetical protein n=1 Tax=Nonomuraea rubra TaxID=46180 RepID=UPI0031E855CC
MSALEHPSPDHHGRRDAGPGAGDGFLRLAKAAAERAARAAERARRAGIRLQRLRAGLPPAAAARSAPFRCRCGPRSITP